MVVSGKTIFILLPANDVPCISIAVFFNSFTYLTGYVWYKPRFGNLRRFRARASANENKSARQWHYWTAIPVKRWNRNCGRLTPLLVTQIIKTPPSVVIICYGPTWNRHELSKTIWNFFELIETRLIGLTRFRYTYTTHRHPTVVCARPLVVIRVSAATTSPDKCFFTDDKWNGITIRKTESVSLVYVFFLTNRRPVQTLLTIAVSMTRPCVISQLESLAFDVTNLISYS